MGVAAFDEAARHFAAARSAAATIESAAQSPVPLAVLLEELGEAELAAGLVDSARNSFQALADFGRGTPDKVALAKSALGLARCFEFAIFEPRRLGALEEAASVLDDSESPLRARVLARLAQELFVVAGSEARRLTLANQAVDLARRLDDSDTLAFSLNAWLLAVWGAEHLAARRQQTEVLRELAATSKNPERVLEAHRWRLNTAVEEGDIHRAKSAAADYSQAARLLRRPDVIANAVLREGLFPQLEARWGEAERLARTAWELQRQAGDPQADVVYCSRRILLAECQGQMAVLTEVLPEMQKHVEARSSFHLYRLILARGLVAAGARADASAHWERVWASDLGDVGQGPFRLATLALAVPIAIALGDEVRARRLYQWLIPFEAMHAAIGATFALGSVAHFLGELAAMLGEGETAAAHFAVAVEFNRKMGAPFLQAQSAAALARVEGVAPAPAAAPAFALSRKATFKSEGLVWRIEADGRGGTIRSSLGLTYLRLLLERPNREVTCAELEGGDELRGADVGPVLDARAASAYRARLDALRAELEQLEADGDLSRAGRVRAEIDTLTDELSAAFGLSGRPRPQLAGSERARTRVTKAISRAIESIAEATPELAAHLERSVKTGLKCSYSPDPAARIDWEF
jgi:hypothetical protein